MLKLTTASNIEAENAWPSRCNVAADIYLLTTTTALGVVVVVVVVVDAIAASSPAIAVVAAAVAPCAYVCSSVRLFAGHCSRQCHKVCAFVCECVCVPELCCATEQ